MNVISFLLRIFIALSISALPATLLAGTIEIEWDPPLTGEVSGYKIYYGTSSGSYQWIDDAGAVTSYTLSDLDDCTIYYWAIKAYDSSGLESEEFSNELSGMARPRIESVIPLSGEQGQTLNLLIEGANFAADAMLDSTNPGIHLLSAAQLNCNEITVTIQIDPEMSGVKPALIGTDDFALVNPDMVFGTRENAFTVTLNRSRIDIDMSGRIDGLDLNRLALVFGISEEEREYNPDCDFDGNGWVDGDDLAYMAAYFGTSP